MRIVIIKVKLIMNKKNNKLVKVDFQINKMNNNHHPQIEDKFLQIKFNNKEKKIKLIHQI